jgi:hypothetical protein
MHEWRSFTILLRSLIVLLKDVAIIVIAIFLVSAYFNGWG